MAAVLTPSSVLPHSQRLRFIRSIRKLGDLLTESSMLVEPSTSPTLPSPPSFLDFSSAESKTLVPAATQRRTFFTLRLPASPLTSTFAVSLKSPTSPDMPVPEHNPEASVVTAPRAHRKRSSTVSVPETSPSSASLAKRAGRRAARVRHTASSTSLRAPHPVPPQERHDEPFSYSTLVPIPSRSLISSPETDHTPDAEMHSERLVRTTSTAMQRKEAGWSGEWSGSVRDMDDVVRGLRNLRLK